MDEVKRPPQRRIIEAKIETDGPELSTILKDALSIYQTEILKMRDKVRRGNSLGPGESRILQGYVKSLVDAAKEMRERDDDAKEQDLTDEQLLEQTKLGLAALEARVEAKKKLSGGSGGT